MRRRPRRHELLALDGIGDAPAFILPLLFGAGVAGAVVYALTRKKTKKPGWFSTIAKNAAARVTTETASSSGSGSSGSWPTGTSAAASAEIVR